MNEFGLWASEGETCGCGFFPAAAMINHSCVPTASAQLERNEMCFYATQQLSEGEEVTFCYGSLVGQGIMTRGEVIAASWGFKCTCAR